MASDEKRRHRMIPELSASTGNPIFNRRALRVKEAKFADWFEGKKQVAWWALLILDLALAIWALQQGHIIYNLFLAAALGKLTLLVWYFWWLKALPSKPLTTGGVSLEQFIEGEVLAAAAKAESPQTLWRQLSFNWQSRFLTNRLGLDNEAIAAQLSPNPAELDKIWAQALELANKLNHRQITGGNLVVVLLLSLPNVQSYLARLKLSSQDLINGLLWQERLKLTMAKLGQKPIYGGVGRDWTFGFTPLLNRFATNISRQVEAGVWHLNLAIHQPLMDQIITALAQPIKNSVALVGETGVGKTTLAYSLAEEILEGNTNTPLKYDQVFSLNASILIANAKNRGELEGLVLSLLAEAQKAKNVIIFLDDAHLFFTEDTGSVNLTNILLPVLQSGRVRLLAAILPKVWQKLLAQSPELAAYFNYLAVPEPEEAVTLGVLEDQAILIEGQTNTTITYQATREAYRLAERYSTEQSNPGKSIKLLLAAANFTKSGLVTASSVEQVIESTLGIKVGEASQLEKTQLLNLESELHKLMINQDYAVGAVANALRRARAGVKSAQRPVGSFLFLGPTGVGKTQLAKALAQVYYGGAQRIVRVDMSEYANPGDEQRLLSADLGVDTHSFLSQVRAQPFCVVLLDEVEKANSQVLNLLLQMLDEGNLSDQNGRSVSFKDAIIIATSNAGADDIRAQIEAGSSLNQFSAQFIDNLIDRKQFLPELINRFDEVVLFRPLAASELRQVIDLMIAEVNRELTRQKVKVMLSDGAKDWLVGVGNDPRLGARPLRRTIQRTVENVIAKRLLNGTVTPGQQVELNASELEGAVNS